MSFFDEYDFDAADDEIARLEAFFREVEETADKVESGELSPDDVADALGEFSDIDGFDAVIGGVENTPPQDVFDLAQQVAELVTQASNEEISRADYDEKALGLYADLYELIAAGESVDMAQSLVDSLNDVDAWHNGETLGIGWGGDGAEIFELEALYDGANVRCEFDTRQEAVDWIGELGLPGYFGIAPSGSGWAVVDISDPGRAHR